MMKYCQEWTQGLILVQIQTGEINIWGTPFSAYLNNFHKTGAQGRSYKEDHFNSFVRITAYIMDTIID